MIVLVVKKSNYQTIMTKTAQMLKDVNIIQIYPVSEGYLRKIQVERRGKYPERQAGSELQTTSII